MVVGAAAVMAGEEAAVATDRDELDRIRREIRAENGLDPDGTGGIPCLRCRQMVQSDENGRLYCACWDERPGPEAAAVRQKAIDNGWVIPIDMDKPEGERVG